MGHRITLDRMGAAALPFVRRIPGVRVRVLDDDPVRQEMTVEVEFPDDGVLDSGTIQQLKRC